VRSFRIDRVFCWTRWDLWWPPVWGGSYWTASLQYRALRGGARLGRAIGRDNDVIEYDAHAAMILEYIQVGTRLRSFGLTR
jgi:glucoamylase